MKVENIEGADKLYKLEIDLGKEIGKSKSEISIDSSSKLNLRTICAVSLPTHNYPRIENWNPTLTVTDSIGQKATKQLYNPAIIKPPVISNVTCPSTFTRRGPTVLVILPVRLRLML